MTSRILIALGFSALVVLAALGTQRWLFAVPELGPSPPPSPSPKPDAPQAAQRTALVRAVTGDVERQDANGAWVKLAVGEHLSVDTALRTGPDSSAELAMGDTVLVRVAEETELAVAEISNQISRIRLDDGRIAPVVTYSEGFRLRVEVKHTDVRAETGEGEFYVMRRGAGGVSVASKTGTTTVSSLGEAVNVLAGEQTLVVPGKAPSTPIKIPPSLLLKLARVPSQLRVREVTVEGTTSPGAVVAFSGGTTTADAEGRFSAKVPLREGPNQVEVKVQDAVGRERSGALPSIQVDTRAPEVTGKVKW